MTKPRILAIDDDEATLQYLSRVLEARYTVITCQDPTAAVELARAEQPDLILCDIDMPVMDGGEVCSALADDPRTFHIPFVYLTAMVSPSEVKELDGYVGGRPGVAKRANLSELVACIESQLNKP